MRRSSKYNDNHQLSENKAELLLIIKVDFSQCAGACHVSLKHHLERRKLHVLNERPKLVIGCWGGFPRVVCLQQVHQGEVG